MAKAKKQQQERVTKRFEAECCNCTARFEADKYNDTQKFCSCGNLLTWNDHDKAKTLEGVRECKR